MPSLYFICVTNTSSLKPSCAVLWAVPLLQWKLFSWKTSSWATLRLRCELRHGLVNKMTSILIPTGHSLTICIEHHLTGKYKVLEWHSQNSDPIYNDYKNWGINSYTISIEKSRFKCEFKSMQIITMVDIGQ